MSMSFEGGDALLPLGFYSFPHWNQADVVVQDGVTEIAGPSMAFWCRWRFPAVSGPGYLFGKVLPFLPVRSALTQKESPSMHRATMCLHFRASAARSPGHYLMVFDMGCG